MNKKYQIIKINFMRRCLLTSPSARYSLCVAYPCRPAACAMKMMAVRATESSLVTPASDSMVTSVSTLHLLLGEYLSTICGTTRREEQGAIKNLTSTMNTLKYPGAQLGGTYLCHSMLLAHDV